MDAILKLIERARPMYEIIQDAVVLTDLHGKIIYVNDSYTRLLGFTKDEVLSKPCASMGLTVSFTFNELLMQLAAHHSVVRKSRFNTRDHSTIELYSSFSLLLNEELKSLGVLIIMRENPVQKENEIAHFEKQSHLLRAINYRMDEMCVVSDIQNRRNIYCTDAVENILGFTAKEFLDLGWAFVIATTHPEDLKNLIESFFREIAIRDKEKFIHDHIPMSSLYRRRHKDGSWRWIQAEAIVLERDEQEFIKYVISFSRDVTREKELSGITHDEILLSLIGNKPEPGPAPVKAKEPLSSELPITISNREREILSFVKNGFSTKEIAEKLELSVNTIHTYRKNLMSKLNARNTAELVRIAMEFHV